MRTTVNDKWHNDDYLDDYPQDVVEVALTIEYDEVPYHYGADADGNRGEDRIQIVDAALVDVEILTKDIPDSLADLVTSWYEGLGDGIVEYVK